MDTYRHTNTLCTQGHTRTHTGITYTHIGTQAQHTEERHSTHTQAQGHRHQKRHDRCTHNTHITHAVSTHTAHTRTWSQTCMHTSTHTHTHMDTRAQRHTICSHMHRHTPLSLLSLSLCLPSSLSLSLVLSLSHSHTGASGLLPSLLMPASQNAPFQTGQWAPAGSVAIARCHAQGRRGPLGFPAAWVPPPPEMAHSCPGDSARDRRGAPGVGMGNKIKCTLPFFSVPPGGPSAAPGPLLSSQV